MTDEAWSELISDEPLEPELEALLPSGASPWPITASLGRFLVRCVQGRRPHSVLELGAGSSSVLLGKALDAIGGRRLTSIEAMPQWCGEEWSLVAALKHLDALMVVAEPRLRLTWAGVVPVFSKAITEVAARGPYDLVLVDSPQWFYGRGGALPLVHRRLSAGAWIIVDDAGRPAERQAIWRWMRVYPDLQLILDKPEFAGKGLAVLSPRNSDLPARASLSVLAATCLEALALRRVRQGLSRRPDSGA